MTDVQQVGSSRKQKRKRDRAQKQPVASTTIRRETMRERKEAYLAHLRTADEDTLWVSLADKVHNGRNILHRSSAKKSGHADLILCGTHRRGPPSLLRDPHGVLSCVDSAKGEQKAHWRADR